MVSIITRIQNLLPTRTVVKRVKIPTKAQGSSGTEVYSGYFDEDYLKSIRGMRGAELFDEMRRGDSQIAMLLSVVKNPIKSAKWDIEPCDDDDESKEIAEFVHHALFHDIRNPDTGKRKTFRDFIDEALTYIEFGHCVFEIVHRYVKGHPVYGDYVGLRDLGFRSQKTLEQWGVRKDGSLDFVRQQAHGDVGVDVAMAGENLLVLSLGKEGDNYEGVSMIRPCYGNWFRKNNYLKFMAIGIEKTSIGVPVAQMSEAFIGQSDYEEQYDDLKQMIENFANHEQQGLILPAGVELKDYKISFDAEKVQAAIDSEDVKMTKRFLANFMELGMASSGGSYALGSDLSDIFLSGITYIADAICEKVNLQIVETLVKAKYGEQMHYPKLVCRGINDKAGKELADIITGFVDKGLVQKSDRMIDFVHNLYGLPAFDPEAVEEDEIEEDSETPPPADTPPEDDDIDDDDLNREPALDERSENLNDDRRREHHEKEGVDRLPDESQFLNDKDAGVIGSVTKARGKPATLYPTSIEKLYKKALSEVSTTYTGKAVMSASAAASMNTGYGRGLDGTLSQKICNKEPLDRDDLVTLANIDMYEDRYKPEMRLDDGGCDRGTILYAMHGGAHVAKWARKTLDKLDAHVDAAILADPKIEGLRPSVFIDRASKDMEKQMRERLLDRSDDMLARVDKILRTDDNDSAKTNAVLDVKMPRAKEYREYMRDTLGEIGKRTQAATLQEVGKPDLKLDEADFKGLPKRSRDRIKKEIELVARYQDADLEKMVYFAVNDELSKNTPPAKIIQAIKKQRDRYMSGGMIFTAATNIMSKVVNGIRNDVFHEPEVLNDIESFIFVNHDPKSAICQNLVGRVFSKEEYEASEYLPPLHHNCKSVIQAQTKGAKGNKPVDPKGLIPSGTDEELEKILKSKTI